MNYRKGSLKQLTQRTKKKYWERVRKKCALWGSKKQKQKTNRIARVQKKRGQRGDKLFKRNNNRKFPKPGREVDIQVHEVERSL